MAQAERKPFHESILAAIPEMTVHNDVALAKLIKTTTIPKNWDEIADAWDARIGQIYPISAGTADTDGVRQSLMEQKAEAGSSELPYHERTRAVGAEAIRQHAIDQLL